MGIKANEIEILRKNFRERLKKFEFLEKKFINSPIHSSKWAHSSTKTPLYQTQNSICYQNSNFHKDELHSFRPRR